MLDDALVDAMLTRFTPWFCSESDFFLVILINKLNIVDNGKEILVFGTFYKTGNATLVVGKR